MGEVGGVIKLVFILLLCITFWGCISSEDGERRWVLSIYSLTGMFLLSILWPYL